MPAWTVGEDSENMANVLDTKDYTEIFRRPAEEEREAMQASKRAEFVINRVVAHLNCYVELYTQRFVQYVAEQSKMHVIFLFIRNLISTIWFWTNKRNRNFSSFDIESSFIDRNKIVVPARKNLEKKGLFEVSLGILRKDENVIVPADGFHIEAVEGACVLQNIEPQA